MFIDISGSLRLESFSMHSLCLYLFFNLATIKSKEHCFLKSYSEICAAKRAVGLIEKLVGKSSCLHCPSQGSICKIAQPAQKGVCNCNSNFLTMASI